VRSKYSFRLAATALESLDEIRSKKVRREIALEIDLLSTRSDGQGKGLVGPLDGVRSVRAASDRYWVLYQVDPEERVVSVLLVGRRTPGSYADVYEVAERLLGTLLRRGGGSRRVTPASSHTRRKGLARARG
jgi:mRNA-degrading endonuclease RelE of RelBE toxin-antitoxin system